MEHQQDDILVLQVPEASPPEQDKQQIKQRADVFLAEQIPTLSRAAAQKLFAQGKVTSQGLVLNKKTILEPLTEIQVQIPPPQPLEAQAEDIPLEIAYEDEDVLVVNKEVGMVVHPAAGHRHGTLVNAILHHCKDSLSGIGGVQRPGIVHRIDKDTSGLLIVAKNDKAHLSLSAQLQDHSLTRIYHAVTLGCMKEESGTISAPLGRHPIHRTKISIQAEGKEAITHYKVLQQFLQHSHLQCQLETGRTHQIRVHLASLHRPLLGDKVYGKAYQGLEGQCLHAKTLKFRSPRTGEELVVDSELPTWFQQILEKLERMSY